MKLHFKSIINHFIAVVVMILVSLLYFKPVLKGKSIFQSDIAQFKGMAQELKEYRERNGHEAYWTDAAFGGMPSYQLSTYYPHDYIRKIDNLIRFLPRPADYLFLYFIGFFVLLRVLKLNWKFSLLGSLAFGLSTYFIIILGVGHNAKAHAIGYIPLVLSGVLLLFKYKWFIGFIMTSLFMALEVMTSHIQMTYYMCFLLLILGIAYFVEHFKNKTLKDALKPTFLALSALILGVVINASSLMATKEYANHSTRGKSELTIDADGQKKVSQNGLSRDYITEYSYGKLETFNLLIPRFMGGGSTEELTTDSNTYKFLRSKIGLAQARGFIKAVPTYWGEQPIVAAPAYIGAGFVLLFFIGLFLLKGWFKNGLVATTILVLLLSWGKNFGLLTDLFIDFVPLYNKFRAVSSIQVIAEITIPLMGLLTLKALFSDEYPLKQKLNALLKGGSIVLGIIVVFGLLGGALFSFQGERDAQLDGMISGFSEALIQDRKAILFKDAIRSLIIVGGILGAIFFYLKGRFKPVYAMVLIGIVMITDTLFVAKRYVNDEDFVVKSKMEKPFTMSAIDKAILEDKGHYRVANLTVNFMNDGATSYFHKSIGGYHAAKLGRYQELADFHLSRNNIEVLNMLNTKYFIIPDKEGKKQLQVNPRVNGNAWFVKQLVLVNNADEEILSLGKFTSKDQVVINQNEFGKDFKVGSGEGNIKLTQYKPNHLTYKFSAQENQLTVFSEIYYQPGWNAYIDGKPADHFRANYVLRAMELPKGEHTIEFKFEPTVIHQGGNISLAGYFLLIIIVGGGYLFRKKIR